TYQWSFTNQASQPAHTSSEINPTYNFNQPGTYTANLIVTASNGCTVEKESTFVVYPNPVIEIEYATECFQLVNFNAISSHADNLNMTYEWDFYNNNTVDKTEKSFTHYFENAQPVDTRLKATDSRGCSSQVINPIIIVEGKADIVFPN